MRLCAFNARFHEPSLFACVVIVDGTLGVILPELQEYCLAIIVVVAYCHFVGDYTYLYILQLDVSCGDGPSSAPAARRLRRLVARRVSTFSCRVSVLGVRIAGPPPPPVVRVARVARRLLPGSRGRPVRPAKSIYTFIKSIYTFNKSMFSQIYTFIKSIYTFNKSMLPQI